MKLWQTFLIAFLFGILYMAIARQGRSDPPVVGTWPLCPETCPPTAHYYGGGNAAVWCECGK